VLRLFLATVVVVVVVVTSGCPLNPLWLAVGPLFESDVHAKVSVGNSVTKFFGETGSSQFFANATGMRTDFSIPMNCKQSCRAHRAEAWRQEIFASV